MKKRTPTFVAGMLTATLIGSLGVGALAATGQLTITVNPINVQVNGQTFQPKDAQGNSVPVFAYNGTTYAPLRALAEAYGLEVGYDAGKNMATVGEKGSTTPTTTSAVSDKELWTLVINDKSYDGGCIIYKGSTHFLIEALQTGCQGKSYYTELDTLIKKSSTIDCDGRRYVEMHDISDFLSENTVDSTIDKANKVFYISF